MTEDNGENDDNDDDNNYNIIYNFEGDFLVLVLYLTSLLQNNGLFILLLPVLYVGMHWHNLNKALV